MEKTKTIRIAEKGIAEELRNMEVGDVVRFHLPKYNYNSVRQAPYSTLINDSFNGKKWSSKKNWEAKSVDVTRTA